MVERKDGLDKKALLELYPGYTKVLGPYERKNGRKQVVLNNENLSSKTKGKLKTISYPKALVEVEQERRLSSNETVDHIDRDFTNNSIDNLQVLNLSYHASLDVMRRLPVELPCVQCGTVITLSQSQIVKKKCAGPFCSRTCSGKYGADVGNGKIKKMKRTKFEVKYYRLEKIK